jgi:hypothetical protein
MDKIGKYELPRRSAKARPAPSISATTPFAQREVAIKVATPES